MSRFPSAMWALLQMKRTLPNSPTLPCSTPYCALLHLTTSCNALQSLNCEVEPVAGCEGDDEHECHQQALSAPHCFFLHLTTPHCALLHLTPHNTIKHLTTLTYENELIVGCNGNDEDKLCQKGKADRHSFRSFGRSSLSAPHCV